MDKKSIALLIIASSMTSPIFATGILSNFISADRSSAFPIVKFHKSASRVNHSYTNFSGTWTLNCGDGDIHTTKIDNDDDHISVFGEYFNIGKGIQGFSDTNEKSIQNTFVSFEWDANGTILVMRTTGYKKDNVDNSPIRTLVGTYKLAMVNDQIILDGQYARINDASQEMTAPLHCVFTRSDEQKLS